jgi:Pentapeptide repeats (8 copies)
MVGTLFVGAIISLIIAAITAYLLLRFMRQEYERIQTQQRNQLQAQESQPQYQAQESQLQHWKAAQDKRLADLEQHFYTQLQQLQTAQKAREEANEQRFRTLVSQTEAITAHARTEYELAQLPRLEDVPLPGPDHQQQHGFTAQRTPPNFEGRDLSQRDLSSRYLSHADLRRTRLSRSKLFMADLSWANLAEADLSEAELSAANLTYANLRGASLRGTNLLVADLNHAILIGADLRDTHNLSLEQVTTTLYDATTLFDPAIADKLPQKARTHQPVEPDHKPEPIEPDHKPESVEPDYKSESLDQTRPISVPRKKQDVPAPIEQDLPTTPELVRQTPTGDVLPLDIDNIAFPARQSQTPDIGNPFARSSQEDMPNPFSEDADIHW